MVTYRHFRNTDPPMLVEVWNEALTGRGAARLHHSSALEYQVFAKPYFDPAGLIIAEEDGKIIGFVHAGFCPRPDETALSRECGVICVVAVRPAYRRRGIGSELLRRSEEYLREKGVKEIYAGQRSPNAPFYHQLYGGADLPGILVSDVLAAPFLEHHSYRPHARTFVLHCHLQKPPQVADPRFVAFRQRYDIFADAMRARPTWWKNCELAVTEPMEFTMQVGDAGEPVAEALIIQLEGFPWTWNQPTVGILDLLVQPQHRRQGMGKYLMTQILNFLHEQCYLLAEVQVDETNEIGLSLFRGLGFEQVDTGKVYRKESTS